MIAILSFLHTFFIRSYRFGPPTFIYLGGIVFIYTVVPNPVMGSYAFSTAFLFIIASVLCYSIMDMETSNQESVTMLHAGSLVKLYCAKLLYGWLYCIPLALFAVIYPAIFHKFDRNPYIEELIMSLVYHMVIAFLGVALACWFSSKFIRSRLYAFLMLTLVIVITLSVQGIEERLPEGLLPIVFLFPSLNTTLQVLFHYETALWLDKLLAACIPFIYSSILVIIYLLIMNRRKLDSPQS